ncbi:hypothetical protein GCM10009849_32810 [Sinomonas flava]|uniref:Uncharacterized protein n=1 Tax=Sinomonas flava TaxID=496857 RepID=A0ABN3C123_9MICC
MADALAEPDGVAEPDGLAEAEPEAEPDGDAEAEPEGVGMSVRYSGRVPSRTGTLTSLLALSAENVILASAPGTAPVLARLTWWASSPRLISPLAGTSRRMVEDASRNVSGTDLSEVLKIVPVRRPGASALSVLLEPVVPEETMIMLRSCSGPTSSRTPSEAEYWWVVCWALMYPQPVADSRPAPSAAIRATRLAGFDAVRRTAGS